VSRVRINLRAYPHLNLGGLATIWGLCPSPTALAWNHHCKSDSQNNYNHCQMANYAFTFTTDMSADQSTSCSESTIIVFFFDESPTTTRHIEAVLTTGGDCVLRHRKARVPLPSLSLWMPRYCCPSRLTCMTALAKAAYAVIVNYTTEWAA